MPWRGVDSYNVLRIRAARSLRSRRIILIELSRTLNASLYLEFKGNRIGDVAQISRAN